MFTRSRCSRAAWRNASASSFSTSTSATTPSKSSSAKAERIVHYTAGDTHRDASEAEAFLRELPDIVRRFERCAVLLYQAGADPHVRDPLGGWMSTEQLAQRDRIVFEEAKAMGVPIAWDLAGGYQPDNAGTIAPVLAIHRNTMRECVRVYAAP